LILPESPGREISQSTAKCGIFYFLSLALQTAGEQFIWLQPSAPDASRSPRGRARGSIPLSSLSGYNLLLLMLASRRVVGLAAQFR
jgi:hypothetical protein